jgi:hypothetical protein
MPTPEPSAPAAGRPGDFAEDLGIARAQLDEALHHLSKVERPLRIALSLCGRSRDVLVELDALRDQLYTLSQSLKAEHDEETGLVLKPTVTEVQHDEEDERDAE